MSDHNPFEQEQESPWMLAYETHQVYRAPSGAQIEGRFVSHAPSQRRAMVSAHIAFVDMLRRLGIRPIK